MNTDKQIEKLMKLGLKELRARYAEATGKETRCPNKTWLAREVVAATAKANDGATKKPGRRKKAKADAGSAAPDAAPKTKSPTSKSDSEDSATDTDAKPTKLSKLSVGELQARYLEAVGRPSGSTNSAYVARRNMESCATAGG